MSTAINVTVGGNGLLDQSRQQMQANRFGRLERDADAKALNDSIAQRLDAVTPIASASSVAKRLTPEPAANRRGVFEAAWVFGYSGLLGFDGDPYGHTYYSSNYPRLLDLTEFDGQFIDDVADPTWTITQGSSRYSPYRSARIEFEPAQICGGSNPYQQGGSVSIYVQSTTDFYVALRSRGAVGSFFSGYFASRLEVNQNIIGNGFAPSPGGSRCSGSVPVNYVLNSVTDPYATIVDQSVAPGDCKVLVKVGKGLNLNEIYLSGQTPTNTDNVDGYFEFDFVMSKTLIDLSAVFP